MRKITHLGKEFVTKDDFPEITDERYEEIKKQFYEKPSLEEVKKQAKKLYKGGLKINLIKDYFFSYLMNGCLVQGGKWTINEMMESKELVSRHIYLAEKYRGKEKRSFFSLFKSLLSLYGVYSVRPIGNFPIKSANYIIKKYNLNGNYFDFSAGWGVRLLSSLVNNVNYYAVDVNPELVEKLRECSELFKEVNEETKDLVTDVRLQGSEFFIPEFENKMGLCFSSPPYYNFEDYKKGDQCYLNKTYEEWLETYIRPTIENCIKYLVEGGYLLINVKNIKEMKLYDDTLSICKEYDELEYVGEEVMKQYSNSNHNGSSKNTDELIMVFRKK